MRKLLLVTIFCFAFVKFGTATLENEIVVRILGGPRVAQLISEEMGYFYRGPVSYLNVFRIELKRCKHLN